MTGDAGRTEGRKPGYSGATNDHRGRDAHYSYDPSTGSWTELSPSPHGYPSGLAYDATTERTYAVSVYGDLYAYDAASNKWFIAEPRPPYANAEGDGDGLVAVPGRLYHVRGGYTRELWRKGLSKAKS